MHDSDLLGVQEANAFHDLLHEVSDVTFVEKLSALLVLVFGNEVLKVTLAVLHVYVWIFAVLGPSEYSDDIWMPELVQEKTFGNPQFTPVSLMSAKRKKKEDFLLKIVLPLIPGNRKKYYTKKIKETITPHLNGLPYPVRA